ncbi:MAG: hypothetical protein ACRDL7_12460, partial [Gaiellaceae bacterium]
MRVHGTVEWARTVVPPADQRPNAASLWIQGHERCLQRILSRAAALKRGEATARRSLCSALGVGIDRGEDGEP